MASISVEELKKMKVNDLKKELKDRGLPVSGTKDVLLERLQAALTGAPVPAEDSTVLPADDNDVDSVEQSIDQLVGDAAPAEPAKSAPAAPTVTAKENIPKSDDGETETTKKVVSLKGVTEAERLKARAQKFGESVSDSAKKLMRAERFGAQAPSAGSTNSISTLSAKPGDMDKLKKRAERFGMVVSNSLSKVDEDEKKRKRLERFGPVSSSASTGVKKIKLNSTDSDLEERKKKRAQRFGLT